MFMVTSHKWCFDWSCFVFDTLIAMIGTIYHYFDNNGTITIDEVFEEVEGVQNGSDLSNICVKCLKHSISTEKIAGDDHVDQEIQCRMIEENYTLNGYETCKNINNNIDQCIRSLISNAIPAITVKINPNKNKNTIDVIKPSIEYVISTVRDSQQDISYQLLQSLCKNYSGSLLCENIFNNSKLWVNIIGKQQIGIFVFIMTNYFQELNLKKIYDSDRYHPILSFFKHIPLDILLENTMYVKNFVTTLTKEDNLNKLAINSEELGYRSQLREYFSNEISRMKTTSKSDILWHSSDLQTIVAALKESKLGGNRTKIMKCLLLGTASQGKATFFKQITLLAKGELEERGISLAARYIHDSLWLQMKSILSSAIEEHEFELDAKALESADFIEFLAPNTPIEVIAEHVKVLWESNSIRQAYKLRSNLGIIDSCEYFFNDIDRICKDDYVPTTKDMLFSRIPTTGIRTQEAEFNNHKFSFYLVGGQRSERRKWIDCLDNVHAVLHFTSLTDYDQFLYEEKDVNAMESSILLFHDVFRSRYLKNSFFGLVFTKLDLFKKKINISNNSTNNIDNKANENKIIDLTPKTNYKECLINIYESMVAAGAINHDIDVDFDTNIDWNNINQIIKFIENLFTFPVRDLQENGKEIKIYTMNVTDSRDFANVFENIRKDVVERNQNYFQL